MIRLTRLNHAPIVLNADLIQLIESTPDTVVTLTNGQKVMVRESAPEVVQRVIAYRRSILLPVTPWTEGAGERQQALEEPQCPARRVDLRGPVELGGQEEHGQD